MRTRLITSTLAIALVSVIMLGVPLVALARHQVWTSARDRVREQAASIATGLEDRLDTGQPIDISRYPALMPDRRILVKATHGAVLVAGPEIHGSVIRRSATVADSTVTVEASARPTVTKAREITLLVVGLMVIAVAAAVGLALWQARRLGRPLADLVVRAGTLGRGEFTAAPMRSGVPEIDEISHVLERSATQIGTLVSLQREFASDAAHQLRTPLTGIGLRLDEIGRIGDSPVRQEAEDALAQVERLEGVIAALLERARGDLADPTPVDLAELADDETAIWRRVLARQDRALVLETEPGLTVLARRAHLHAVVTSLLDNALTHGSGDVRFTTRGRDGVAEVAVLDAGGGVSDDLVEHIFDRRVSGNHGTGLGLALARSLAAAEGGTLTLAQARPAEFVLALPLLAPGARRRTAVSDPSD